LVCSVPELVKRLLDASVNPFWKLTEPVLFRFPLMVYALASVQLPLLFKVPELERLPLLVTVPVRFSVPVLESEPYRLALPMVRFPLLEAEPPDWLKFVSVRVPALQRTVGFVHCSE